MKSKNPALHYPILTVSGVVMLKNGFMHPLAYRDLMGVAAYEKLLAGPRVQTSYDKLEVAE